jgi:hypothetical protein
MLSSPSLAPVVSIWFPLRLRRAPAPSSGAVPSALPPPRHNYFVSTDRYPGSDRYLVGRYSPIRGRPPVFFSPRCIESWAVPRPTGLRALV